MDNQVQYKNESGKVLHRRGGEDIRPGDSFWSHYYEAADSGFTVIEDNLPPVVRFSEEFSAGSTPRQIDIPGPKRGTMIEVTVQAVSDGAAIELGFNRSGDPTAPVDAATRYYKCVDTRMVRNLQIFGAGTVRVILSEVIG